MKILLELRAGEGGKDAKLLVHELANMYIKFAENNGAEVSIEERGGL